MTTLQEAGNIDGPHVDRAYLRSLGPEAIAPFEWLQQSFQDRSLANWLPGDIAVLRAIAERSANLAGLDAAPGEHRAGSLGVIAPLYRKRLSQSSRASLH